MEREVVPTTLEGAPSKSNPPRLAINTEAPVPPTSSNGPPLAGDPERGLTMEGTVALEEREGGKVATPSSGSPRLSGPTPSRPSTPISFQHSSTGPQKLFRRLRSLRHQLAKPAPPSTPSLSRRPSYAARAPRPILIEEPEPFGPLPGPPPLERPAIKIRLVTWNMYDSLPDPSGDLSEFLGEVKGWRKRQTSLSTAGSKRGSVAGSIISVAAPASLPAFPLTAEHPYHLIVVAGQECPTASGVLAGKMPRAWDGRGWTSMLESWLCGDCPEDSDDELGYLGRPSTDGSEGGGGSTRSRATTSGGEEDEEEQRRGQGPYVLVEKERLMPGIYIAVFSARSCQGFVEGTSKGRVTAGLLGGRLGNKGGVAISLSFAGSRLLFISAHLAAHASGLEIRKANVRKILEEMEIDDFTGQPARHGGDVSDRFDQAFFLGDLNFRLNISRLHADFLIKSNSFTTALEFDQLRGVLAEENSVFKGFQEAPINFAPTYKYDVIAKVKRKRSGLLRTKPSISKPRSIDMVASPTDLNSSPIAIPLVPESKPTRRDEDSLSIKSTSGSVSSYMSDYVGVEQSDCSPRSPLPTSGPGSMEAVRRAQVRFLTLVRKNSGRPALSRTMSGSGSSSPRRLLFGATSPSSPRPGLTTSHSFSGSPSAPCGDDSSEDEAEVHVEPVFDSSSKQRVQSYTDRILFKTNVGKLQLTHSRTLGDMIVDSIKGLVLRQPPDEPPSPPLHHSYFAARPVLDHPSRKIKDSKSSQSWSDVASVAGEPRHFRFANFFGRTPRRRLSSRSVDSLVSPPTSPAETVVAPRKLARARSLHAARSSRRSSFASPAAAAPPAVEPAVAEPAALTFWKKVSGVVPAMLADLAPAEPALPPLSPATSRTIADSPTSTAPSRPSSPPQPLTFSPSTLSRKDRRSQSLISPPRPSLRKDGNSDPLVRKHRAEGSAGTSASFTHSQTSTRPTSQSSTLPNFFRTPNSRNPSRAPTRTPSNSNSNSNSRGRFKSFFHFLPLPFLSTTPPAEEEVVVPPPPPPPPETIGPRLGEIQVLEYNAVVDLAAMKATSDHRPVFAVVAIGIGEE